MATPERPYIGRRVSRVPGGFDTDEDLSPIKTEFDYDDLGHFIGDESPSKPPQQPARDQMARGESSLDAVSDDGRSQLIDEGNTVDEKEIRRKLMDMDSSFLPDTSPATHAHNVGIDDTYVVGTGHPQSETDEDREKTARPYSPTGAREGQVELESPATPPEMYQTPAPGRGDLPQPVIDGEGNDNDHYNTSSLETMSSSPTAAAAARTVSRVVSMASMEGYETADDTHDSGVPLRYENQIRFADSNSTPKKGAMGELSLSKDDSPTPTKPVAAQRDEGTSNEDNEEFEASSPQSRRRPTYLSNRRSSQRLSYSSYTTNSTEGGSDLTVGADYALQSGGSVPYGSSLSSRPSLASRGTSLGSMASGITNLGEGEDKIGPTGGATDGLGTLDEEDSSIRNSARDESKGYQPPETPKATTKLHTPTETVIAQHVRDVKVPATMAREFHDRYRPDSPDKRNSGSTMSILRNGKSMTLKEQSNTIDKYMKLNWDLQLKITFLNQALNQRSDEGVKAMISENVELNTARVNLAKEIRELKRSIRTLERDIEKKDDELARMVKAAKEAESLAGPNSEELQEIENEVKYLRERVTTYEVSFEKMRHDSIRQEGEKRRMAEILKTVSRRGGSDLGVREELVSNARSRKRIYADCSRIIIEMSSRQRQHAERKQMRKIENFERKFGVCKVTTSL